MTVSSAPAGKETAEATIVAALGARSVVLVGMMGAGKSTVGRRLATRLNLAFVDADQEIEAAAGKSISDIFAEHGEPHFRDGEAKVIARLLQSGPVVLATGGGAVLREDTRERIRAHGVSIWLKADVETVLRRVRRRSNRPLLQTTDQAETVAQLIAEREPVYALAADIVVVSRDVAHEKIADECLAALYDRLTSSADAPERPAVSAVKGFGMSAQSRPATSVLPKSDQTGDQANVVVNVGLDARAYDIVIGRDILDQLGERVAALRPGARTAIVTDHGVAKHWLARTKASLAAAGISTFDVIVGEGEQSKTYPVLTQVCEALIAGKLERNDLVIALGGGVVGDLAGFAASIVRRGMDFVQVPTSLLAQVDSSVGGKTGINSPHGKNLVGAFHQPRLVVADTAVLDTLSPRQFAAGYAEVAKYGVLGDEPFLAWLEANHAGVFKGGAAREYAIAQSCRAKAAIVARDEREDGERALLNLGHTFGHALEAATGFSDRLFHGEGVAIGMSLAAEFSADLGMISHADAERVCGHLNAVGLPTRLQDIGGFAQEGIGDADSLLALMGQDKKVKRGKLTFILLQALGQAVIVNDVDPASVKDFLTRKLS